MAKTAIPRGTCNYTTSEDGILIVRWQDNKVVTLMSVDMGVEPRSSVYRYCSDTKRKEQMSCPFLIKSYDANMGGTDKSDMLVHLYSTPLRLLCVVWCVTVPCPCLQQPPDLQAMQQEGEHHNVKPCLQVLPGPSVPQCWVQLLVKYHETVASDWTGLDTKEKRGEKMFLQFLYVHIFKNKRFCFFYHDPCGCWCFICFLELFCINDLFNFFHVMSCHCL